MTRPASLSPAPEGPARPAAIERRPYTAPPGMRPGCLCGACWGGIPLVLRHVRNRANCPLHKDIPNGGWTDL